MKNEKMKKIFCTGPTRAAKAKQKSLVLARQTQRTSTKYTQSISTSTTQCFFTNAISYAVH
jgi:hypothetical protein